MTEELKITKKTSIGDVIKQYPRGRGCDKNILGRVALPVRVQKRRILPLALPCTTYLPILLLKS